MSKSHDRGLLQGGRTFRKNFRTKLRRAERVVRRRVVGRPVRVEEPITTANYFWVLAAIIVMFFLRAGICFL